MPSSCQSSDPHLWSVAEYHKLLHNHLIGVKGPTELIAGRIVEPSWQPKLHQTVVQQLRLGLHQNLQGRALVRSQQPVLLGLDSEPKPDIAIVRGSDARYHHHSPTPVEIALIIEVADGNLVLDCYLKAIEYAEAGIPDYWVFDISRQQLYVFRDIFNGSYRLPTMLRIGDCIQPLAFPELMIKICSLPHRDGLTRYGRGPYSLPPPPMLVTRQEAASPQQLTEAENKSPDKSTNQQPTESANPKPTKPANQQPAEAKKRLTAVVY